MGRIKHLGLAAATLVATTFTVSADTEGSVSPALTPEAFNALTVGKTFTYAAPGRAPYGAETYFPNQRVRWSFLDGTCKEGYWTVDLGLICFVYEDTQTPQCWSFYGTPPNLTAQYENTEDGPIYDMTESAADLDCPGPLVGV